MPDKKLIIGLVTYKQASAKYLPKLLESLRGQTWQDFELLVYDNSGDDRVNAELLQKYYPEADITGPDKNLGFGRAHNLMIRRATALGAEYYLALNPDMILEPDFLEALVGAADVDGEAGSLAPKLKRWDFENNKKTNNIDSCGLILLPPLRFVDLGQGEKDKGQYDKAAILGPSGAAGLYRLSALADVAYQGKEYFDEAFFMYREDCDLAYRLFLKGYKSALVPRAVAYHDRSAAVVKGFGGKLKSRKLKSRQIKEWSWQSQLIIYAKYWPLQSSVGKIKIIGRQIKVFVWALFFERYLIKQWFRLIRLLPRLRKKH